MSAPALAVEPELQKRGGRYVTPAGRNPKVYNYTATANRDDWNGANDSDAADLPVSDLYWPELIRFDAGKLRPVNDLPALPAWIVSSPELLAFIRGAPLPARKIGAMTRSRDVFAKGVRDCTEAMISEYNNDDERRHRTLTHDQCQRLLLAFLPLADRAQGVDRSFLAAVRARLEDLRASKRTRRRAEMMTLYRAMLCRGLPLHEPDLYADGRSTPRDRRIAREVAELLRDEGRPRQVSTATNPDHYNSQLWYPPQPEPVRHIPIHSALLFTTKNETSSGTWRARAALAVPKKLSAIDHAPNI